MSNDLLLNSEMDVIGEKGNRRIDDTANFIALPFAQGTRGGMGMISQFVRCFQDFLAGCFAHVPILLSIEDIRNGSLGYSRLACTIETDGSHTPERMHCFLRHNLLSP